jgi:multiphosphoryl transfer protein
MSARRVLLPDALHARPANLLVRLAQRFKAAVAVKKGDRSANAARILEVLSLGAAKGDEIELVATGDDALAAMSALAELVERGFSSDLVPEEASAAVEGIAIGRAAVILSEAAPLSDPSSPSAPDDRASVRAAFARAASELRALVASLPPREAQLFEPEVHILDELEPAVLRRMDDGERAADALDAATQGARTDLILDARARVLEALASGAEGALRRFDALEADAILVTDALTPSLVAVLPAAVVGLIATSEDADAHPVGFTSHAAILARGRGLPLAYVAPHVAAAIADGELVVVDTTGAPASVWVSPSDGLITAARARRADHLARESDLARAEAAPLDHLGITVRVNVSSVHDALPAGAQGVGLLRTELVFAGHHAPPSEAEQLAAALAVAARAQGEPVTARLFDAGGDKPLAWLPAPSDDPDARGMALLFANPDVLAAQVRALARAAERAPVRILLPLVRSPRDVEAIRELAGPGTPIGAMIETPEAVDAVDDIARASDFVCVGTNDLSAALLGQSREVAVLSREPRLFREIARIVAGAHAAARTVTVCGELAGDPAGARALVGLGVDALSVSPPRFAPLRTALAAATRDDCARAARDAVADT